MWSNMFNPEKPRVKRPADWKRILSLFAPYWKHQAQLLCCILIVSLLGLLPPLCTLKLIDQAIPQKDFSQVCWYVGVMVLAALIAGLIGVYQGYLNSYVGEGIVRDIRANLVSHLHRMPIEFFASTKTGEIMNRVSGDVENIDRHDDDDSDKYFRHDLNGDYHFCLGLAVGASLAGHCALDDFAHLACGQENVRCAQEHPQETG
jgi:hypothetical protein